MLRDRHCHQPLEMGIGTRISKSRSLKVLFKVTPLAICVGMHMSSSILLFPELSSLLLSTPLYQIASPIKLYVFYNQEVSSMSLQNLLLSIFPD